MTLHHTARLENYRSVGRVELSMLAQSRIFYTAVVHQGARVALVYIYIYIRGWRASIAWHKGISRELPLRIEHRAQQPCVAIYPLYSVRNGQSYRLQLREVCRRICGASNQHPCRAAAKPVCKWSCRSCEPRIWKMKIYTRGIWREIYRERETARKSSDSFAASKGRSHGSLSRFDFRLVLPPLKIKKRRQSGNVFFFLFLLTSVCYKMLRVRRATTASALRVRIDFMAIYRWKLIKNK